MYRVLLIVILLIVLFLMVRRALRGIGGSSRGETGVGWSNQMIQDPVCRVYVPRGTAISADIGGQTYYFCSTECARSFQSQLSG